MTPSPSPSPTAQLEPVEPMLAANPILLVVTVVLVGVMVLTNFVLDGSPKKDEWSTQGSFVRRSKKGGDFEEGRKNSAVRFADEDHDESTSSSDEESRPSFRSKESSAPTRGLTRNFSEGWNSFSDSFNMGGFGTTRIISGDSKMTVKAKESRSGSSHGHGHKSGAALKLEEAQRERAAKKKSSPAHKPHKAAASASPRGSAKTPKSPQPAKADGPQQSVLPDFGISLW